MFVTSKIGGRLLGPQKRDDRQRWGLEPLTCQAAGSWREDELA
jgi:hypothetical protein